MFQSRWIVGKTIAEVAMSKPTQRRENEPESIDRSIERIVFTDGSEIVFESLEQSYEPGYVSVDYYPAPKKRS